MPNLIQKFISSLSYDRKEQEKELGNYIVDRYNHEAPPAIAIIGAAGVGKTSTINSLFGTDLYVSHDVPGTRRPKKMTFRKGSLHTENGDITFYDMPGIRDSKNNEGKYIEMYYKIISQCDVAVWVVSATDKGLYYDQTLIEGILAKEQALASHLVIAINKVDMVFPFDWNSKLNLPSCEQIIHIKNIRSRIFHEFREVCPALTIDRVIPYSAYRYYRLQHLFNAMLKACPEDRAWVLYDRQQIPNFWEKVPSEVKKQIEYLSEGN